MTRSRPSRPQIHAALTAFAALFSVVGIALYGLPFFYDFMVTEHGWTRQEVTSGNAYSKLIVGPPFGFLAGWLIDRFGPRRLMLLGIMMAGAALIGLGYISTFTGFYLFYLLNALGYVCGGPLPNQVLLSRWFDRGRGKAMGFAYLGIGVGGALVPLLAVFLINQLGWQMALQTLGLFMIVIALPLAWTVNDKPEQGDAAWPAARQPPAVAEPEPAAVGSPAHPAAPRSPSPAPPAPSAQRPAPDSPAPSAERPAPRFAPILRMWPFYLLLVASMCSIGAVGGTMQNLKLYLALDIEYSQAAIGYIASLVLVGSIIGRLTMGWLADLFPKKYVMLLIYSIVAGSIPLLYFADSWVALHVFALVFGIGLGGDYMIIPLMAAELFGVKVLGRVMGVVLTADVAAEAVAPMIVATMRDQTGSYAQGFLLLILLAAVGAAAVVFLPKHGAARRA